MALGNASGAVVVFDGENPRTFTATAREVISGGEFVFVSGGTGIVGKTADSVNPGSITVAIAASSARVNGIALANAGSNELLTVATRGSYLVLCTGSVFGGNKVELVAGTGGVQNLSSGTVPTGLFTGIIAGKTIGRAQTDGASGTASYALVDLQI